MESLVAEMQNVWIHPSHEESYCTVVGAGQMFLIVLQCCLLRRIMDFDTLGKYSWHLPGWGALAGKS